MTTALSKRHQARNERALQELIKTIPGNDRCADCQVKNPGWASWSLGIFLCMRCASLHRKLGTHISKVKSLSMDSWSNEQVDSMKRNGNAISNRTYNPRNTKPSIPLDVDEVDAALERFIRQKYDQQIFSGGSIQSARRNNTGSTRSSDEQPPPLPPKPGKRLGFGLRSVSSAFTLSKPTPNSPPRSPEVPSHYRLPPSPIRVNKQSRVFGASVGGGGENLESKLATLRDMGFPDEKTNLSVLKGFAGNLERAIESLVRLGEGSAPNLRSRTPMQVRNIAVSQPLPSTRQRSGLVGDIQTSANGHTSKAQVNFKKQSNNEGNMQAQDHALRDFSPTNPFEPQNFSTFQPTQPQSQPQSATFQVEQSFQNMHVSQPLFPNATGGYPSQHHQLQGARVQQSMTPPVPQLPNQNFQSNSYAQYTQVPSGSYNPFFQIQQTQWTPSTQHSNLVNQQAFGPSGNNYTYSSNIATSPMNDLFTNGHSSQPSEGHSQQQQTQTFNPNSLQSQGLAIQHQTMVNSPQYAFQQYQTFSPAPPQPLQPQQTGRFDKTSILALYNYPQLAPAPLLNANEHNDNNATKPVSSTNSLLPNSSEGNPSKPVQRSVTMPVQLSSGSRNPFNSSKNASVPAVGSPLINEASPSRHMSQESIDGGGFQKGRHSPDAFASLSARSVR